MLDLDPMLHHPQPHSHHPALDLLPSLDTHTEQHQDKHLHPHHPHSEAHSTPGALDTYPTLSLLPSHVLHESPLSEQQLPDLFALARHSQNSQHSSDRSQQSQHAQLTQYPQDQEQQSQQEEQQVLEERQQQHRQTILERRKRHRPSTRRLYSTQPHAPKYPLSYASQYPHSHNNSNAKTVYGSGGSRRIGSSSKMAARGGARRLGGGAMSSRSLRDDRTEAEFEAEFARLWRYIWESEDTVDFRRYKERKKVKGTQQAKRSNVDWTYKAEYAFFRALVRYAPMGRAQVVVDGVLMGRNMLVLKSVREQIGIHLDRKEISSHLQYTRPMFRKCPLVLQYYPTKGEDKKTTKKAEKATVRSYQPIDFEITQHPGRGPQNELLPSIHTYTRLLRSRGSEVKVDASRVRDYRYTYPQFVEAYESGMLNCEVYVFDVSIELMAKELKPPDELGILLTLAKCQDLGEFDRLESHLQFYSHGRPLMSSVKEFAYATTDTHTQVPFGSDCWVEIVKDFSNQLYIAQMARMARGEAGAHHAAALQTEERVRRWFLRLSVVHEIIGVRSAESHASVHGGVSKSRRLMCSFWKFRLAEPSEKGEARWQSLVLDRPKADDLTPTLGASPWISLKDEETTQGGIEGSDRGSGNFDPLRLDFSSMQLEHSGQPFDQHSFGLDDLSVGPWAEDMSGMGLSDTQHASAESFAAIDAAAADVPCEPTVDDSLPQHSNEIDFSAGHITICMESEVHDEAEEGKPQLSETGDSVARGEGPLANNTCYPDLQIPISGFDTSHIDQYVGQQQQCWDAYAELYESNPFHEQEQQYDRSKSLGPPLEQIHDDHPNVVSPDSQPESASQAQGKEVE